ncbi:hypothetical protein DPMN_181304 [Dreissena polymorpha]|uniref:Uncharacterized protein n=1 Tax=Dreissena polymorpha TaxID=45954 RepID=A0A9D4DF14_DREPO|nr:hypothetical protein DPMN_181304 [Dreissena polymorpha]
MFLRRLIRISYMEHKTNEYVRNMTAIRVGPQEPILATVKRQKLALFGRTYLEKTLYLRL